MNNKNFKKEYDKLKNIYENNKFNANKDPQIKEILNGGRSPIEDLKDVEVKDNKLSFKIKYIYDPNEDKGKDTQFAKQTFSIIGKKKEPKKADKKVVIKKLKKERDKIVNNFNKYEKALEEIKNASSTKQINKVVEKLDLPKPEPKEKPKGINEQKKDFNYKRKDIESVEISTVSDENKKFIFQSWDRLRNKAFKGTEEAGAERKKKLNRFLKEKNIRTQPLEKIERIKGCFILNLWEILEVSYNKFKEQFNIPYKEDDFKEVNKQIMEGGQLIYLSIIKTLNKLGKEWSKDNFNKGVNYIKTPIYTDLRPQAPKSLKVDSALYNESNNRNNFPDSANRNLDATPVCPEDFEGGAKAKEQEKKEEPKKSQAQIKRELKAKEDSEREEFEKTGKIPFDKLGEFYKTIDNIAKGKSRRKEKQFTDKYGKRLMDDVFEGQFGKDFYSTPIKCLDDVAEYFTLNRGANHVLEVSAGLGAMLYWNMTEDMKAQQETGKYTAIEINKPFVKFLKGSFGKKVNVIEGDFFEMSKKYIKPMKGPMNDRGANDFDFILMNPPFSLARDGKVNKKAYLEFLFRGVEILKKSSKTYEKNILFISPPLESGEKIGNTIDPYKVFESNSKPVQKRILKENNLNFEEDIETSDALPEQIQLVGKCADFGGTGINASIYNIIVY